MLITAQRWFTAIMCEQIPILRDPLHVHTSFMGLDRQGRQDFSGSSGRVTLCIICHRLQSETRKIACSYA